MTSTQEEDKTLKNYLSVDIINLKYNHKLSICKVHFSITVMHCLQQ